MIDPHQDHMVSLEIERLGDPEAGRYHMRLHKPLNDILSSQAKVAVLRAVLRVSSPLSGREIVRRADVAYSPGYKALQSLVASGVLSKQHHGRATTYAVRDPETPLTVALRALFAHESDRARSAAKELAEGIADARSIILYGSEARGEAKPGSDTDLLIIVDTKDADTEERIADACLGLADRHGLALSWLVVDAQQIHEWDDTDEQFWRNVVREGIRLHGDSLEALRLKWRLGRTSSERHSASGT